MTRAKSMYERRTNQKPFEKKIWRVCPCAEQIDKLLVRQGARLTVAFTLDGSARAIVATHRERPRVKLKALVANYCPFCGKKYEFVGTIPRERSKTKVWTHKHRVGEPEKRAAKR